MTDNTLAAKIYTALLRSGVRMSIEQAGVIQQAIDDAETERWIPVERRLPEDDGRYLVLRTHGYRDIMIYDSAIRRFVIKDVTHWQPLPPPGERAEPGEDDEAWPDASGCLEAGNG